jgi:hypothetical protein
MSIPDRIAALVALSGFVGVMALYARFLARHMPKGHEAHRDMLDGIEGEHGYR